jgi:hypothetical protein
MKLLPHLYCTSLKKIKKKLICFYKLVKTRKVSTSNGLYSVHISLSNLIFSIKLLWHKFWAKYNQIKKKMHFKQFVYVFVYHFGLTFTWIFVKIHKNYTIAFILSESNHFFKIKILQH